MAIVKNTQNLFFRDNFYAPESSCETLFNLKTGADFAGCLTCSNVNVIHLQHKKTIETDK